jgi:hypothetical protein
MKGSCHDLCIVDCEPLQQAQTQLLLTAQAKRVGVQADPLEPHRTLPKYVCHDLQQSTCVALKPVNATCPIRVLVVALFWDLGTLVCGLKQDTVACIRHRLSTPIRQLAAQHDGKMQQHPRDVLKTHKYLHVPVNVMVHMTIRNLCPMKKKTSCKMHQ